MNIYAYYVYTYLYTCMKNFLLTDVYFNSLLETRLGDIS